ncbi:MAG: zinc ABC transporter ATP-binding protein AztA [Pseudomonadota bacterium]
MTSSQGHAAAVNGHETGKACLRFDDLTLGYQVYPAVHGLSGELEHGALLAVVGPNGSGKSTLVKGIAGVLQPMSGTCAHIDGCRKAYLPQLAEIDRSFPATVFDLVKLGLWHRTGLLGRFGKAGKSAISEALAAVGLEGFAKRGIDTLSGGQFQRALFARVILQDADLILLDEPFNAIDEQTIDDLLDVVKRWHREGRTVIAVMHDLDRVRQHFPDVLLLSREPVAWGPVSDVLRPENLERARKFRPAWDETAPWCADHDHDRDQLHNAPAKQGPKHGSVRAA